MKALAGLLAVLVMLSSASLAQAPTKPEAESQAATPAAAPTASTPSTETDDANAAAVPAAAAPSFAPGAKLYLELMGGFDQYLFAAIAKKKVPVVIVKARENADFVMSGAAHVKRPGVITGMVITSHGGGNIAVKDAHTGNLVYAEKFRRVDGGTSEDRVYQIWAEGCAKHMKKAMEKK
jgi:hypothetical protein